MCPEKSDEMSRTSMPVDWEVFSIPPIQPVQYYSILKKRRDFSQLIKQYDSQVFRHGYLHYCGIVPKYLSSSLSNRYYDIFVILLNDTPPTTSFIGFRIKVSKETFTCERNSLLLFLKNSEKSLVYSMDDNRIHVNCGRNAWELFYLLYDDFLKRYMQTIIGTQFFYHFVYSDCMEKDKQLLKFLYKGSKVVRISKSSIYFKIHRKRKISVTDLIHMTLNMPKRKKYTFSYFSSKGSLLHSDVACNDFYTVAGNKINVSKLMLKKYKKLDIAPEKHCQKLMATDVTHKRKFVEIDTDKNLESDTSSKTPCTEDQWKQYRKIKFFTVQSYSTLSFINPLVPKLLENGKSSNNSNLHSIKHSNTLPMLLSSSDRKKDASENLIEKAPLYENKPFDLATFPESVIPKDFLPHYSGLPSKDHQSISCTRNNLVVTKSCDSKIINVMNEDDATEDVTFTTAAGKAINVSSEALLKAYKLCENKDILSEKSTCNVVKHEVPDKTGYLHSKKKIVTKDVSLSKIFVKNENMPKRFAAAQSSYSENQKLDYFNPSEEVTFSTAAGKTINISNTAIEAAQKLIDKSTDEEKMSLPSENLPVHRNQLYKNEISNNSCTSNADDVDLDNTLVEHFFEDVQFDEKELELAENIKKDDFNVISESKSDKNLPVHKPRKSLGGRRSMRYCSDKL